MNAVRLKGFPWSFANQEKVHKIQWNINALEPWHFQELQTNMYAAWKVFSFQPPWCSHDVVNKTLHHLEFIFTQFSNFVAVMKLTIF